MRSQELSRQRHQASSQVSSFELSSSGSSEPTVPAILNSTTIRTETSILGYSCKTHLSTQGERNPASSFRYTISRLESRLIDRQNFQQLWSRPSVLRGKDEPIFKRWPLGFHTILKS